MELSSMLAGERFGDRPKSVCRVIASFLRAYNDAVDDERRQDLYRCAAEVVGTRSSRATERARLARCERELADVRGATVPRALRFLAHGLRAADPSSDVTGFFPSLAAALTRTARGHERALALVDELVHIDVPARPPCHLTSGKPPLSAREGSWVRS
jgi:hypothetical protein